MGFFGVRRGGFGRFGMCGVFWEYVGVFGGKRGCVRVCGVRGDMWAFACLARRDHVCDVCGGWGSVGACGVSWDVWACLGVRGDFGCSLAMCGDSLRIARAFLYALGYSGTCVR